MRPYAPFYSNSHSLTTFMSSPSLPLVSIVVATYNGGLYLRQQLESVVAQTYSNLEIIITDDGSKDDTIRIANDFAERYANFRLLLHQENLGYVKNFERGCLAAQGRYIALCDQDDWWHPQKIEKLIEAIGPAPLIYTDSELCDEQLNSTDKFLSQRVNCLNFDNPLQQAVFCRIYGHTMLMQKAFALKAIPFPSIIPHDWWLSYVATVEGGIRYYPEALSKYRQHSNNIFGAVGSKTRKHNKADTIAKKKREITRNRQRIQDFYERCPSDRTHEKQILKELRESYQDFSLPNNFKRMLLFFKHHRLLLASKKRSLIRQYLFCLKMFASIK